MMVLIRNEWQFNLYYDCIIINVYQSAMRSLQKAEFEQSID